MLSDRDRGGAAHARPTRREVLRGVGAAAVTGSLLPIGAKLAAADEDDAPTVNAFANVTLPPDIGQAALQAYVPATGHTVRGSFLDYWRANGAASVYGNPISEPFAAANGFYSQAFENAVFQYRPEFFYTEDPIIRLMPIDQRVLHDHHDSGDDRRRGAWQPLDADHDMVRRALDAGDLFIEATGHTVSGDILSWYQFNEGAFYLGHPLTEPFDEDGLTAQYFEGGLLRNRADDVGLAPIAKKLASRLGIDTTPVEQGALPLYDELMFWTADNPSPLGDPYALGPKWIEVSVSQQSLWAYQGDTLIHQTLVSTGADPNLTELGMFHIRLKYPEQDLGGFTDTTGEVIGFGDAPEGTIPYLVENVPQVMYFNMDAEAFHGTYWHRNFGTPMSHGCVNLPLDVAAWLYGWAPIGTGVWVHE